MKRFDLRFNGSFILLITLLSGLLLVRSGKYTVYVNLIYFVLLTVFYKIKFTTVSFVYSFYFFLLLLIGIYNYNDFDSILEDIFSFWPLIILFINGDFKEYLKKNLFKYLVNSLFWLFPISILIFKYMEYGIGSIVTTRFDYNESTNFELFAPIIPILFAPYLIFYFDTYNRSQKIIVILSNGFICLMGLITLSRSISLNQLTPIFLIVLYKLAIFKIKIVKLVKFTLPLICIFLFIFNSNTYKESNIKIAIDGIEARSEFDKDNLDITSGRFDEATQYLNQDLSIIEILFGRGLGGHKVKNKNENFIGGINMLHFGPLHLFMKGGIILLLIIYLPIIVAIFWFWRTKDYRISLSLIFFLIGNLQTSNWSWGMTLFIFWFNMLLFFDRINFKYSK